MTYKEHKQVKHHINYFVSLGARAGKWGYKSSTYPDNYIKYLTVYFNKCNKFYRGF